MTQIIFRLVTNLTDLYYWKFFLQPFFLMYAVVVSIYLYLMVSKMTLLDYLRILIKKFFKN